MVEFPQRRYIRGKRAFWDEMATRGVASPGDLPCMLTLERDTEAVRIDIAQCAWGSRFQKFTTLLCSPRMAARPLSHMGQRGCPLCDRYIPHEERATGTFADGSSRAEASGTYPSEMCYELAVGAADCPRIARRATPRAILLPCPGAAAGDLPWGAGGDDDPTEPAADAVDVPIASWREDSKLLGEVSALDAPIFRTSARGGTTAAYCTSDVRTIVRGIASSAGEVPVTFGGRALASYRRRVRLPRPLRHICGRRPQGG